MGEHRRVIAGGLTRRQFVIGAGTLVGGVAWIAWRPGAAPALATPVAHGPPDLVDLVEFSPAGQRLRTVRLPKVVKSDDQWRRQLSRLEFDVMRRFDDEVPFTGAYWNLHDAGTFLCRGCDTAVFASTSKFDSGTGWPSFTGPIAAENVALRKEGTGSGAMVRVLCKRCDAFLGDLFDDGPPPAGLRYCINSASLRFVGASAAVATDSVVFAAGCFWGVQAVFQRVRGVTRATSGYAGGDASTADYEKVSTGTTGHAESVKVVWDPAVVSFDKLLQVFFTVAHDPTQLNRQGPDVGPQYRSAIFYRSDEQRRVAEARIKLMTGAKVFPRPIVTQVVPLTGFHAAEDYHQDYFDLHPNEPYIRFNDAPKVEALKAEFPELYREKAKATR